MTPTWKTTYHPLVVWNIFFPYIGNNHPNWLIFFRGMGIPPTRHFSEQIYCFLLNLLFLGPLAPPWPRWIWGGVYLGHSSTVLSCAMSLDGSRIASCSEVVPWRTGPSWHPSQTGRRFCWQRSRCQLMSTKFGCFLMFSFFSPADEIGRFSIYSTDNGHFFDGIQLNRCIFTYIDTCKNE